MPGYIIQIVIARKLFYFLRFFSFFYADLGRKKRKSDAFRLYVYQFEWHTCIPKKILNILAVYLTKIDGYMGLQHFF